MKKKWQILILTVLALFGCAYAQPIIGEIGQTGTPSNNTVLIQLASFQPDSLTVPAGTTVTWINRDIVRHTVTSTEGLFDSDRLGSGESFSYTFNEPGTFDYYCTIHPIMQGTVIVTEAEQPPAEQAIAEQATAGQPSIPPSSAQQLVIVPEQPQPAESFSQFYIIEPQPAAPEQLVVEEYEVSGREPEQVYFGGPEQQAVSYTEYEALAATAEPNALWIQGRDAWVRYVQVPRGSRLTLLALTQTSGPGTFYQVFPSGRLDQNSFFLYPFSAIDFYADNVGQHLIFFVKDNVPSNVVIIDVQPFAPPAIPLYGRSKINIISDSLTGYEVYVDDVYQFTEGAGGIPDGRSSFTVPGNMVHKITIRSGGLTYTSTRYFASGQTYNINLF
ncbi:MAG TPA: plastocyanin/azurin family copper-binding protein [Methanotrichaceae archaeon]|nr:plastocyanin/azurin family copper-binding protein [Methanotrichaceae archaeon]